MPAQVSERSSARATRSRQDSKIGCSNAETTFGSPISSSFRAATRRPRAGGNASVNSKRSGMEDPLVCADFVDDRLALLHADSVFQSSTDTDRLWTAPGPVVRGRWIRYLLHVRFDPDPAIGFLRILSRPRGRAGHAAADRSPGSCDHEATAWDRNPIPVNARIGIYRDRAAVGPARVYFAGYTVGHDPCVVEANAFGQTPVAPRSDSGDQSLSHRRSDDRG